MSTQNPMSNSLLPSYRTKRSRSCSPLRRTTRRHRESLQLGTRRSVDSIILRSRSGQWLTLVQEHNVFMRVDVRSCSPDLEMSKLIQLGSNDTESHRKDRSGRRHGQAEGDEEQHVNLVMPSCLTIFQNQQLLTPMFCYLKAHDALPKTVTKKHAETKNRKRIPCVM